MSYRRTLIEALATALTNYEYWCEQANSWAHFKCARTYVSRFWRTSSGYGQTPAGVDSRLKIRELWHNKSLPGDIQQLIHAVEAFTYDDYLHTNAPTNKPRDPRTHGRKYDLLNEMNEAFSTYKPEMGSGGDLPCSGSDVNQLEIWNAKRKEWTPAAIKQLLKRYP